VYVFKFDNEYVVTLNDNGLPRLRINNYYRNILKDGRGVPESTRDFIRERIKSATWLIKSIQQRQRTMYKVSKSIVSHQHDFLEKGVKYLKPLVLRDIAQDVEVHESTVSRVTNGKYIHTPRGVFELKFFFTSRVSSTSEDGESMESVKSRIKEIISDENPNKPITDKQIMEVLKGEGIFLARRTIAKYREMMGILSSAGRREG
jgi:RNA polymerase sigma-54 factor